jgi:hypothetical protein
MHTGLRPGALWAISDAWGGANASAGAGRLCDGAFGHWTPWGPWHVDSCEGYLGLRRDRGSDLSRRCIPLCNHV